MIHLDVNRSLHLHIDELPHDLLKKFLVLYARAHPEMAYCQGMNYLAGEEKGGEGSGQLHQGSLLHADWKKG